MQRKTKIAIVTAGVAVAVAATTGIAVGTADDAEAPITGAALDKASEAALEHTGGGEVTDTEVGDEESYYEVEVTLPSGKETDVQLDRQFNVVGSEAENKGESDD